MRVYGRHGVIATRIIRWQMDYLINRTTAYSSRHYRSQLRTILDWPLAAVTASWEDASSAKGQSACSQGTPGPAANPRHWPDNRRRRGGPTEVNYGASARPRHSLVGSLKFWIRDAVPLDGDVVGRPARHRSRWRVAPWRWGMKIGPVESPHSPSLHYCSSKWWCK